MLDFPGAQRLPNGIPIGHPLHRGDDHGPADLTRNSSSMARGPTGLPHHSNSGPLPRHLHPGLPPVMSNGKECDEDDGHRDEEADNHHKRESPTFPQNVRDTLTILNAAAPFRVRHKKDHSLTGRAISFDASVKQGGGNSDCDLKLFVEYPLGSGGVHNSMTTLTKLMVSDSGKDLSKVPAAGIKYLEYEMKHGGGDWRSLCDFFPETVRSFKEPLKRDCIPVPFLDSALPPPRLPRSLSTPAKGVGRLVEGQTRKRKGSPSSEDDTLRLSEEHHRRQMWMQSQAEALKLTINSTIYSSAGMPSSTSISPLHHTPTPPDGPTGPHSGPSPMAALINVADNLPSGSNGGGGPTSRHANMSPNNQSQRLRVPGPVSDTGVGSTMPESTVGPSGEVLKCTLCQERLEDTHFVQCPSIADHKFCFPCSRDSIKRQGAGAEVYCPSGKKCPLVGSNVPWAFMQNEIATILGDDYGTKDAMKIKKERDG